MTDKEIIKALEDYKNSNIVQTKSGVISIGDVLDLVNRQQAEIDELKAINESLKTDRPFLIAIARVETIKEFVEKLKRKFNDMEYNAQTDRKTVKIDELRERMDWVLHAVVIETIDKLKDEMVGEE